MTYLTEYNSKKFRQRRQLLEILKENNYSAFDMGHYEGESENDNN